MLQEQAEQYSAIHRRAFEVDTLGEIETYWQDENGVVCIAYTCGTWYHYKLNGNSLEWW